MLGKVLKFQEKIFFLSEIEVRGAVVHAHATITTTNTTIITISVSMECHHHVIIPCTMTSLEVISFLERKFREFLGNKNLGIQIQRVSTHHHGYHSHLPFHGLPPMLCDHSLQHVVIERDIILHKKNRKSGVS